MLLIFLILFIVILQSFKPIDMQTDQELKDIVRQKYSEIALQDKESNQASCC